MSNLLSSHKLAKPIAATVAGTGTTNGVGVDLQGFDSVTFVTSGAVGNGAAFTLKAQGSDTLNSGYVDLTGASATIASNSALVAAVEVTNPRHRYVRPVVVIADVNSTIDNVIALVGKSNVEPVSQSNAVVDTVNGVTIVHAPAEAA